MSNVVALNAPQEQAEPTLAELVIQFIEAKATEAKAAKDRKEIQDKIIAAMPTKDEGSVTEAAGMFKATVTYKIDRKADTDKLKTDWEGLPAAVQAAFKFEAKVSTTELRKLGDDDFATACKYFESKPASPGFEVKAA